MTKRKTKRQNHMRCMTYKDREAFMHRKSNRQAFINMLATKLSDLPSLTPLSDYFDITHADVRDILKVANATSMCMSAPYYKACRNPLLCEECLSMWRYKLVKNLQRGADEINRLYHQDKLYFLIRRTHDFILPRGLIKGTYNHPDNLTYLLSDAFKEGGGGTRLTHRLWKFQQQAGHIFDDQDARATNAMGFGDKNINDLYSIYTSAVLPRQRSMPVYLDDVLQGPNLVAAIPFHMTMEQSFMGNLEHSFGGATRRTFRLIDDNSLLCLSFQTLMLCCRPFDEFTVKQQERLTHGTKQKVSEYRTPVYVSDRYGASDMYASNRITIEEKMYMVDDSIPEILKFVEAAFPYNQTIDNMTPFEYVLCYYGLSKSKPHFSSCAGVFRDNGKKTQ